MLAGVLLTAFAMLAFAACGDGDGNGEATAPANGDTTEPAASLSGTIVIDGSSTVAPISEAVAEEFMTANSGVRVTVGTSGTGGGFELFCNGETDISDASRPIADDEIEACAAAGIEYEEFQVAFDGLSVLVNPANDFVECLTVDELKAIWEPAAQDTVTNWNQVRADFPDQSLTLYGPGTDSGTFDYFTDEIVGEEGASRGDYTPSEDDNILVQGIAGDEDALGYFGFAYYVENQSKLKVVQIDHGKGKGCVTPSAQSVEAGTYTPLARPIFIYVRKDAADRPEVKAFVEFYLKNASKLVGDVGYVPLPANVYGLVTARFTSGKTGTAYTGDSAGLTLEQIFSRN
jgi:phosphate transport system substrate-binding protein